MIDIEFLKETHTWGYILIVNPISDDGRCHAQALLRLCPDFSSNFLLDITDFGQEDRRHIQQFLNRRRLLYYVDKYLLPSDD